MYFIYNTFVYLIDFLSPLFALLPGKTGLFFKERKQLADQLKSLSFDRQPVWFHAASTGEYEQALPVIKRFKKTYPDIPVVLSFFSPSGYRAKYKKTPADVEVYLPLDTQRKARFFLRQINPRIAVFVKYEIWPNFLYELKEQNIPAILISAVFRENHPALKYGFLRKALSSFTHIFVQDEESVIRLKKSGIEQVQRAGDTRFDTVVELPSTTVDFPVVSDFKNNAFLIVAGSTWEKDEEMLLALLNRLEPDKNLKLFIIPHEPTPENIRSLTKKIKHPYALYSNYDKKGSKAKVLVGDVMGLLKYVYRFGDVAYVGGGFGKGIHNTLEPGVYGKPVIFGPNYHKFKEAEELIKIGGGFSVNDISQLEKLIFRWMLHPEEKNMAGEKARQYVLKHTGASEQIISALKNFIT